MVNGAAAGPQGGRHSAWITAARTKLVLAVVGACMVVAAVILVSMTTQGPGPRPPASSVALKNAPGTPAPTSTSLPTAPARAQSSSAPRSPAADSPAAGLRQHQDPLGTAAASYVSSRTGTVLAAVYDIGTGQTWRLGQGRPQAEASVVKLDVLETLLARQGALTGSDQSLARQMIEDSDNDAATSLWYAAGGAAGIGSFDAEAGLEDTAPSPCVECPGFPLPGWGLTTTTAADQITLLRELVEPGRLLSAAARGYALSLMENVTPSQRWGISGGVPPEATVALKNGWLPLDSAATDWQINSVGWISGDGRDYLVAVLSTGNPSEQYGIDTIDGLAAIVWGEMRPAA